jgi:subtilisin family serine protease
MKPRILSVVFALIILALAVTVVGADGPTPLEPQVPPATVDVGEGIIDETPSIWFVELKSPAAVEGTSMKVLNAEKKAFRTAANQADLKFEERFAFSTLWNGLSIKIDPADLGKLARIKGVKALYPVETISMPEVTAGGSPELFTALTMTGADVAQSELGYTGAGVKVAVMDTGIDYDHPDLGGCFGPGCRVEYGYDFVGDAFNADDSSPSYNPETTPDDDPDDCQGHGSHVAGIVGADGTVTGVAPGVTFGAYRVFGCEGSTFGDIMIAAMEMALADDMDILNMSIGSSYQWPEYPTAVAADHMVQKGMVVVASIGNSGSTGTFSAGAPGVGEKVIGVAAFDNSHTLLPYFEVNSTGIGYVPMTFAGPTPTAGTEEIVYIGRACNGDALEGDAAGKVALIVRGACSFNEKAPNAIAAGATGVVIHNNASGTFNGTLGAPIDGVTPVVGISGEDGFFIRAQETPVFMTWTDQMASFPSPTGGLISSFSSYGLAPDLSLKPDIGAPGGNIYSTYPLEKGGYATMGGTSMSSPHVAGAAALLLEAKPGTTAEDVRTILQNSADPHLWSLAPSLGLLEPVHRQGAGMVDIDDAILSTAIVSPGKIALGESESGVQMQQISIRNTSDEAVTYEVSYESAITTSGTWSVDLGFWLSDAFVDFSKTTVKVNPGGNAKVKATFYPATGPDLGMYGGYIVFTPDNGGAELRVPFAGFIGDYQSLPVFTANPYGLPWLWESLDGDLVYSMEGWDVPEFWVNLGHQSEIFRIEIFDANTGETMHYAYDFDYFGRNSNYNNIYSFIFDGYTIQGQGWRFVPDGDYYAVFEVLKANGIPGQADHWETWTSPVFTIDRP